MAEHGKDGNGLWYALIIAGTFVVLALIDMVTQLVS